MQNNNDDMALGAIEALKAAGYYKGDKFIPKVVGVSAPHQHISDSLKAGENVRNDIIEMMLQNQGKAI